MEEVLGRGRTWLAVAFGVAALAAAGCGSDNNDSSGSGGGDNSSSKPADTAVAERAVDDHVA